MGGLELILVSCQRPRLLPIDDIFPDQFLEILVERLHSMLSAGLDRGVHLGYLVLTDEIADRRCAELGEL